MKTRHMTLNVGPQHPATHGVLRVQLTLDGETIIHAEPIVGYLHTGIEKNMEAKKYTQAITMTDRMDYLSPMSNNFVFVSAVEKLMGIEVPLKAQYARVVLAELTRLNSHLVWVGTHATDMGAATMMLFTFREREKVLKIYEMCSGVRMMSTYFRIGGLAKDLPEGFDAAVKDILDTFPAKIDEYEGLLTENPIWRGRCIDVGVISGQEAIKSGLSGPMLRASGINWDIRKANPYSSYDKFDFDVPIGEKGDTYDRYKCRVAEMRQSLRIIRQAMEGMPDGQYITADRKVAPPPKDEVLKNMEQLIHHFKYWTEGIKPPVGDAYVSIESPKGEIGCYVVSDGSPRPYRVHFRPPSFINISALNKLAKGMMISDLIALIGTTDIVLGEVDR